MDINKYDNSGRTRLMNAAIAGDLDEVRRLLDLGADPDKTDELWRTTKAVDFAGRLASNSEVHRQIHELLVSRSTKEQPDAQGTQEHWKSFQIAPNVHGCKSAWLYETVEAVTGRRVTRLRSSIFYLGGLASFIVGILLILNEQLGGGGLVLFLAPCLLLYPVVRFLFGGKDSVAAAVTTVVVEEVLKNEIRKAANKKRK